MAKVYVCVRSKMGIHFLWPWCLTTLKTLLLQHFWQLTQFHNIASSKLCTSGGNTALQALSPQILLGWWALWSSLGLAHLYSWQTQPSVCLWNNRLLSDTPVQETATSSRRIIRQDYDFLLPGVRCLQAVETLHCLFTLCKGRLWRRPWLVVTLFTTIHIFKCIDIFGGHLVYR